MYTYHVFIRASGDGHLGCFHVLSTINSAAAGCMYLFKLEFSSFLDICSEVRLADQRVARFLFF